MIPAPLIIDDEVVGAISLWRTKVEPFDERTTTMLRAFRRPGRRGRPERPPRKGTEGSAARARPQGASSCRL